MLKHRMEIKDYNFQKKKKIHPEKCCHRYQVQQHSNTHTHKSKLMKAMAALTLITGTQSKNRGIQESYVQTYLAMC